MRIDETLGGIGQAGSLQRGQLNAAQQRNQARGKSAAFGTQVELSADGRAINRAKQIALATPEVRAERVAALRAQVEAGTYVVNSQLLARRILEELNGTGA